MNIDLVKLHRGGLGGGGAFGGGGRGSGGRVGGAGCSPPEKNRRKGGGGGGGGGGVSRVRCCCVCFIPCFSITVSYFFLSFVSVSFSFLGSRIWVSCCGRLLRFGVLFFALSLFVSLLVFCLTHRIDLAHLA